MKNPLHDLDKVTMSAGLKEKTVRNVMAKRRKNRNSIVAFASVMACAIFAFSLRFLMDTPSNNIPTATQPYAYVALDINPSMELHLDAKDQVIDVISYNKESEHILQTLDLQGYSIVEALQALIEHEEIQDYMLDGFLQVSVYSEDSSRTITLEQQIDRSLSKVLTQDQYSCSCASKSDHEEADKHHMSFGRYQLIEQIMTMDSSYTIEALETYSMRELKNLYSALDSEHTEENPNTSSGHHSMHHAN